MDKTMHRPGTAPPARQRHPWRLAGLLIGSTLVASTAAAAMNGAIDLPVIGPLFEQTDRVDASLLEQVALATGGLLALAFISRRRRPGRL
ncbi:MAG: hypothetical protein L6Q74_13520 [Sphaerotilus natans subsp. sulfidivorans]|uniref:hypothetical protein n=1 Tax=Sphaerotilus sulfidivorans TaxID=639200 RepID=UPI0023578118|nr:hypothetical protein [Sphaerotilus sulfidivorans]MCK6402902.1 hypothetical protein [Sphaerotilus sulfidivorans]